MKKTIDAIENENLVENCEFINGRRLKIILKNDNRNKDNAVSYTLMLSKMPFPSDPIIENKFGTGLFYHPFKS